MIAEFLYKSLPHRVRVARAVSIDEHALEPSVLDPPYDQLAESQRPAWRRLVVTYIEVNPLICPMPEARVVGEVERKVETSTGQAYHGGL